MSKWSRDHIVKEWKRIRYDYKLRQQFLDQWIEDIEEYYSYLDLSPINKNTHAYIITSFFKSHKIPLEIEIQKRAYVKYHNRDIERKEIERILTHVRLRDKLFFLMMAESGLRPNTLVQLKYKHIKEDFEKSKLIEGERFVCVDLSTSIELIKDRVGSRWSFIGNDCIELLKEYLASRGNLNDEDLIFVDYGRETQRPNKTLSTSAFSNIFNRAVVKLGIDKCYEYAKPKKVTMYTLRKYFRNNVPSKLRDFREFWMCHTLGTDAHYITRDKELHRQKYSEAYPKLRIYQPIRTKEIEKLREENRLLKETISKLSMKMEGIQYLLIDQLGVPEEKVKSAIREHIVVSKILDEPEENPKRKEE